MRVLADIGRCTDPNANANANADGNHVAHRHRDGKLDCHEHADGDCLPEPDEHPRSNCQPGWHADVHRDSYAHRWTDRYPYAGGHCDAESNGDIVCHPDPNPNRHADSAARLERWRGGLR